MALLFVGMLFALVGMAFFPGPLFEILLGFAKAMFGLWLPCLGCAIYTALVPPSAEAGGRTALARVAAVIDTRIQAKATALRRLHRAHRPLRPAENAGRSRLKRTGRKFMHASTGVFRALVMDRDDPEHRCRLKVHVPVTGIDAWAEACLPSAIFTLPEVGDMVWVTSEDGDPRYPVWIGVLPGRRP